MFHSSLIEFAGETLDLSIFFVELEFQRFCGRNGCLSGGEAGDDVFQLMIFAEVLQRAFAGDGFDAPNARGDTAFFQDLDQADLAGGASVGAAAKFGREVADPDHAHFVAVLLSEQRHGVILVDGRVDGDVLYDFDALVAQHFFVDEVFNVLQFLVFDRGEVREVEAQMIGRDQRSGLLDVLAEDFAQPGVQKMGGGVVAHCGLANRGVNDSVHFVAHANRLLGDDLLCANALDRVISSRYFSDDRVQFVAI